MADVCNNDLILISNHSQHTTKALDATNNGAGPDESSRLVLLYYRTRQQDDARAGQIAVVTRTSNTTRNDVCSGVVRCNRNVLSSVRYEMVRELFLPRHVKILRTVWQGRLKWFKLFRLLK